jgi:hypothetical protein
MTLPFCEDFEITVGARTVGVHFDFRNRRVCWSSGRDYFCYDADVIFEFRDFINERRYETVTSIVNEFQYFFAIRRQRAFWIVHSMLDPRWCTLEVVFDPGCVVGEETYTEISIERRACFEALIDRDDLIAVFTELMTMFGIKPLTHCGLGARYALHTRYVPFSETECNIIETDYQAWLRSIYEELESWVYGG